jgi:nicotinamidase-related amidase
MPGQWVHLCVDMQRMFAEETRWHVPWMREVSQQIEEIANRHPERTIFTRFITPARPEDMIFAVAAGCQLFVG